MLNSALRVPAPKNGFTMQRDEVLGEIAEQDEIIREYSGDRLVDVRVVRAGETR